MASALSPDARDALLATLKERTTSPGFHYLSADHLQRLGEAHSDGPPVVSLFLELTPEARVGDTWRTVLKDLRERAASAAGGDKGRLAAVQAELDRIEGSLNERLPRTGRAVAFFACEGIGLFEQLGLPAAAPSEVHVSQNPYLRPLARVRDEHDRFVVALISARNSRFFFSQIGLVEEVYELDAEEGIHVTDFVSKDERQDIAHEQKKNAAHTAAHALQLIAEHLDARHVIYSAPAEMEAEFLDGLDQAARQKVAGSFGCDTNATVTEVAEKAAAVQAEVEAKEEAATLDRLGDLLSTRGVAGLADTVDMLNQQRVMTLIIDDGAHVAGGVDEQSGMLTTETAGTYPATGGPIRREDDLFDVMIESALAQSASVELVRSEAGKAALKPHGPAAAILRF